MIMAEHAIRVAKSEIGFIHYEGRNYQAMMRHQTLSVDADLRSRTDGAAAGGKIRK